MLVYRVEMRMTIVNFGAYHEENRYNRNLGPYRSYIEHMDVDKYFFDHGFYDPEMQYDESRHPLMRDDYRFMKSLRRHHMNTEDVAIRQFQFGFTSKQKLARWFDKYDRQKLTNAGYVCMVYEVRNDQCIVGGKQCAFQLQGSSLIEMIQLKEIY